MSLVKNLRLSPLPTIKELLLLYRLRALKKLSQNFLLNLQVCNKIVKSAGKIKNCEVCEVGPGPGGITRSIMMGAPKRIILIEKDKRFQPMLDNLAKSSVCDFNIIYADILDFDLNSVFSKSYKKDWDDYPPDIHIIGNLPFNVSTFLIIKWMKDISLRRNAWSLGRVRMTLTFQEEVAQRMVAPILSKQRCRMSVICQNYCNIAHKFTLPGRTFLPKPKVNVGVVVLEPLVQPIIAYEFHMIEKVVRTIFHNRQKYSFNPAMKLFPEEVREKLTTEMFEIAELNPKMRPFQIANEEWGRLCYAYKRICDRDPSLYSYNFRDIKRPNKTDKETEIMGRDDDDDDTGDIDFDELEKNEEIDYEKVYPWRN